MIRQAFPFAVAAMLGACAAPLPLPSVPSGQGHAVPNSAAPRDTASPPGVLHAAPRSARRGFPTAEATASGTELAFVRDLMASLQPLSFAGNREYCGYIGHDPAGRLMHTPPVAGAEASCPLPPIPQGMTVIASYHTHGTYSPWYASEWPTTQDVNTDAADGIDGYIATPGGRLWHVDTDTMTVRQICGRGCLPQDPNYRPEDDGPLRPVMTYDQLLAWERS
ncbi:hypothetical protein ruthe_01165 [Rubellimicrobium thermophilum DSM 16684]|uniref:DUF4329 domain-containing protein n=1 Tax=Rubellimicrobium thermophilum DSM 16684 TaxID=1123069 RepID=S9S847_9RHOB|nr:DUF4329 domain-containing protein [Rubellimicrobium thermophilum]EPX86350.1 hypothetical protein ruthe_01165 [Rubellimicrobium thermophilum DSM 16684]